MFDKITVGQKVVVLLAIGFGALVINVAASLWLSHRTENFAQATFAEQQLRSTITKLLSAAQDVETGQRGFLLTNEEIYLEPFYSGLKRAPEEAAVLRSMGNHDPAIKEKADRAAVVLERRLQVSSQTVTAMREHGPKAALDIIREGNGKVAMDEFRQIIGELSEHQDALVQESLASAQTSSAWLLRVNLFSIVLILALGALTANIVLSYIRELDSAQRELRGLNANLERTVRARTGEVMRANEEIQRFAYIVSHDLRAPLVNIMGFTSELSAIGEAVKHQQNVIVEKAPELVEQNSVNAITEELPEAIGFIRSSTAKMDRLIDAILKLSREGRRVLTPIRVHMTELVQEIAGSLQHQVTEANAEIKVGDLPNLVTDRLAVEQVFGNLMENALKYLSPDRQGRITVSGREDSGYAVFTIVDNGRGIDPKDQERVFELFRRAGKQDKPGEGLGLAFVRNSVRRLGGSISVTSALNEGATFTVRLPKTLIITGSEPND